MNDFKSFHHVWSLLTAASFEKHHEISLPLPVENEKNTIFPNDFRIKSI